MTESALAAIEVVGIEALALKVEVPGGGGRRRAEVTESALAAIEVLEIEA